MATLRSPRFSVQIPAGDLDVNETFFWNLDEKSPTKEQTPMNWILIQNLSGQMMECVYADMKIFVGAGKTWCDPESYGLRSVSIRNISTAPNTNIVNIVVCRSVDADAAIIAKYTNENMFDIANGVL